MKDFSTIPLAELFDDRAASVHDIAVCRYALTLGINTYGNGVLSVADRIKVNEDIIATIDAELSRRETVKHA